jgi:carbon storage regulator CsrA
MLVLSRKREETIVIPDLNVTFRVLAVHAGKVKIGIEAPEDAVIMRGELLDARPAGPVCVLPERDSSG